jgi:hypothetical protein
MVAYRLCIVAVINEALHKTAGHHHFQLFDVAIPLSMEQIQENDTLRR